MIYLKRFSIPDKVVVEDSSCDDSTISLDNEFKFLDKLFHCSLGKELSLGITKDMIGRLEYSYILKDYSINGIYNTVTLELERKYYTFGISFYNITDIKTNGLFLELSLIVKTPAGSIASIISPISKLSCR